MTDAIEVVRTVRDLRARVASWREAGETVALVPTMGAIHRGHLSLVALGRAKTDRVVASIFVNPLQFGPKEDFGAYPRNETRDVDALEKAGSSLVYAPDANEMYPPGFCTSVQLGDLTGDLCGANRPGHFDGVATVVTKLLLQCAPDKAIFGEKDYQQLLVIRRFVRDLDIPVEILGAQVVREADGLALSSRNAYLNADERKIAPTLHRTLQQAASDLMQGQRAEDAEQRGRKTLEAAGFRVDYVAIRDPDTLKPLSGPVTIARILAAANLGKTRLIDNISVDNARSPA